MREMALKDNNTTGRFTKQQFTLEVERVPIGGDAVAALQKLVEQRAPFHPRRCAGRDPAPPLGLGQRARTCCCSTSRAEDEELRQEECRANVLHTAPDRYMLADALAQYLVWKKWQRWLVVKGVFPEDLAYLDAIERAAKRFGGSIVEEREYKETPGADAPTRASTDPAANAESSRKARRTYDVLSSPTRGRCSGPYLPVSHLGPAARSPAPPASVAMSWHPAHEQWGATQMQNRFQRFAKRFMLAARLPGLDRGPRHRRGSDAHAARPSSRRSTTISGAKEFNLAAFKGQKVTFRSWDGQLRQPIIIAGPDHAGVDVAAGGLPAQACRGGHARHRRAGDKCKCK